jgi:hypothetical protein
MRSYPLLFSWNNLLAIAKYVVLAMIIMLIGTMARNILYIMNMRLWAHQTFHKFHFPKYAIAHDG